MKVQYVLSFVTSLRIGVGLSHDNSMNPKGKNRSIPHEPVSKIRRSLYDIEQPLILIITHYTIHFIHNQTMTVMVVHVGQRCV